MPAAPPSSGVLRPTRNYGGDSEEVCASRGVVEVSESLVGREFADPRPSRHLVLPVLELFAAQTLEHADIAVSRAPARALRALSRRFRGWIASPAHLGVHRPTRASGDGAEGVERIEGARRRR